MNNCENLQLRWDDFETNIRNSFRELREEEDYFDVTLACEDGPSIEAHRIILSAGSQLFKEIFKKSKHRSPFIYLKGISSFYLGYILDFLYNGEASITQDELATFLETARELQVKGLQSEDENVAKQNLSDYNQSEYPSSDISNVDLKLENVVSIVDATEQLEDTIDSDLPNSDNESVLKNTNYELGTRIEQMIRKNGMLWECISCGKMDKQKSSLKNHIETHIEGITHTCHLCNKTCSTRNSLASHITNNHSSQLFDCNTCGKFGMTKMVYKNHKSKHHKNTLKL